MNPFRSVGAKLSLALVGVVAMALALVYLVVVPSLERNLVDSKLSQLEGAAPSVAADIPSEPLELPNFLDTASGSTNARVVIYQVFTRTPPTLRIYEDSYGPQPGVGVRNDPIVRRAVETLAPASGVVTTGSQQFAEAAVPVGPDFALLLRAPLVDPLANVRLVRRRLLLAGAVALLGSLLVGYGAASIFARRVRRLERAAERIADGEFDQPVVDQAQDELGELANAFERMRERLARLDHARNEFIANASHELRTPLFSLGGFLELLDDEELEPATRSEFVATMREQVDRLTRLATDLLDLSRLDAGRLRVEREPVDLADVARVLVEEFGPRAAAADHRLALGPDDPALALADPARALQIGRTLVENAVRHTPPGTTVRVSVAAGRDGVGLAVEDDGGGIPDRDAKHVFDRFYRVDGGIASGSGLGLAIARELAELMGGSIRLSSRAGRTVFTLELPATAAPPFPRENVEAAVH